MEARQGGDSSAGSVHDSPPRKGDARESHKQERNGKKRKKRKKRKKNNNKHGNHRKITSEKNMPDTSQTGRVTGDASAWPASLPAGVSLPGVFARADRRPPPPALYHLFLLPCKM
ncbi:pilus assembly protein [Escherichia coli O26]|nr:pilus assembly protein [Escherichia coli O26]HDD9546689.1 pilus assembly protein [Escherichia coli]